VQTDNEFARLLQWMMVVSLASAGAVVFASAVSWISVMRPPTGEIERSLDVVHEHALKVFETIERSLSEIRRDRQASPTPASPPARRRCICG